MSHIRYICLSDMHFGAPNSLLTNLRPASSEPDPLRPSPVCFHLAECLRLLVSLNPPGAPPPTLILNGDILELALADTNQAAMAFCRFVELVMPETSLPLFDRIIFVPGNHDHHLWEINRETQYLNYVRKMKPDAFLPIAWHTTSMFVKPRTILVPECFLKGLLARYRHLRPHKNLITVFYPNFGVIDPAWTRALVFHHGHFTEPIYHLISILRTMIFPERLRPVHPWDLEAENFAWINFFWSAMGRSGEVGKDVGVLYERLQDETLRRELVANLSRELAKRYDLPLPSDWAEATLLEFVLNHVAAKICGLERLRTDASELSPGTERTLREYVENPLKHQILIELGGTMPAELTLVLGHTHKPYEKDHDFAGYPEWVNTYNTGGWVVDTETPEPLHGASILIADDQLDTAAVRMYQENEGWKPYRPRVTQALRAAEPPGQLFLSLRERINFDHDPWNCFAEVVAEESGRRSAKLKERIHATG